MIQNFIKDKVKNMPTLKSQRDVNTTHHKAPRACRRLVKLLSQEVVRRLSGGKKEFCKRLMI